MHAEIPRMLRDLSLHCLESKKVCQSCGILVWVAIVSWASKNLKFVGEFRKKTKEQENHSECYDLANYPYTCTQRLDAPAIKMSKVQKRNSYACQHFPRISL